MPQLISATATGKGVIYYTMYGTENFKDTLDWWVSLGAIRSDVDLQFNYMDVYDGYTLSVENLKLEYKLEEEHDHNLVCFVAKEACNCAICQGLYYNSTLVEILPKGRYYEADEFYQWYLGNINEPEGWDIETDYFANNIDGDYEEDLTGEVDEGYEVWRFQPKLQGSVQRYGRDYRFSPGDKVIPLVWMRDYNTDAATGVVT